MLKAKPVVFVGITEEVLIRTAQIVDRISDMRVFKFGGGYKLSVRLRDEYAEDVQFVRDHFGGYYSEQIKAGTIFWLNLQQLRGRMFLEQICEYLDVRYGQAAMILEFYRRLHLNGKKRLTDAENAWRDDMIERIKKCNVR